MLGLSFLIILSGGKKLKSCQISTVKSTVKSNRAQATQKRPADKKNKKNMPRTTNPQWQLAKPLLEQDYRSVEGIDAMTPDQVIALRPGVYDKVPRKNFVTNWRAMKTRLKENPGGTQAKRTGPTAWEIAKELLEKDYLAGELTDAMTTDEVIASRPTIYNKVPRTNFVSNWRLLKIRIKGHKERAKKDDERYEHDMEIYMLAKDYPWEWHGSEAERLLKEDVAVGHDLRYPPWLLFLKRDEYQEFDYQVFRKHVHQEARAALETPYWMVHKEKKQVKKKMLQEAVDEALEAAKLPDLLVNFAKCSLN